MEDDFLMGFAAHAHTMKEMETDQLKEAELRRIDQSQQRNRTSGRAVLYQGVGGEKYEVDLPLPDSNCFKHPFRLEFKKGLEPVQYEYGLGVEFEFSD